MATVSQTESSDSCQATREPSIYTLRLATESDIPQLEILISGSARVLLKPHYSADQIEAALGSVFAVDRQLILDNTYYVTELGNAITGCGGWSKRRSMYGGHGTRTEPDSLLDPRSDPARIRAFFVDPEHARRGIGRKIMSACENAITAAGFRSTEIMATAAGELLYQLFGYVVIERLDIALSDGQILAVCRMARTTTAG